MWQKYILQGFATLLFFSLVSLASFSLAAQQESAKPKIITGVGFEISYPFLTEAGIDAAQVEKDRGRDESETYLSIGGRIPFLVAFKLAEFYGLGFGAYISFAYQMARLDGKFQFAVTENYNPAPIKKDDPIKRDGFISYERGEISFSPVFYNELALGEKLALSFAVGPTFALSFGDKQITVVDGSEVKQLTSTKIGVIRADVAFGSEFSRTFEREDALQFSFGMLLDLGFQIRFSKVIGMGVDTFVKFYFTGQKTAINANTWSDDQTYLGNWGGTLSLLLFL